MSQLTVAETHSQLTEAKEIFFPMTFELECPKGGFKRGWILGLEGCKALLVLS